MTFDKPAQCSVAVESSPEAVNAVCRQILAQLRERSYDQDDVFAVHLALEEALLNAVKHGNKMNSEKCVEISYTIDSDKVEICVTDEGPGFDPDQVPDPRMGDNLYRPTGRGLLLMNAYMDVVEYSPSGNTVSMVRYRKRPS